MKHPWIKILSHSEMIIYMLPFKNNKYKNMKQIYILITILFLIFGNLYAQTDTVTEDVFGPTSLVLNGNDLYIAEAQGNKISKINITATTPTTPTDVFNGLSKPTSLVLNGNDLYIAEELAGRISKIDISATVPVATTVITGLNYPVGLALNGNNLYIAEYYGHKISKIDITSTTPTITDVVTGVYFPTKLALNGDYLYIAIAGSSGKKISKIDITSTTPTIIDVVAGLGNYPSGMTFNGNDLYFCDSGESKISKIDITSTTPTIIDVVTGLNYPVGLFLNGNVLYIAISGGNKISKINLSTLSVNKNDAIKETYIFPNPTTNQATISLPNNLNLEYVNIYNTLGQKIQTITSTIMHTSTFAKGIYYVEVVTNQGKTTKKLIKQ